MPNHNLYMARTRMPEHQISCHHRISHYLVHVLRSATLIAFNDGDETVPDSRQLRICGKHYRALQPGDGLQLGQVAVLLQYAGNGGSQR